MSDLHCGDPGPLAVVPGLDPGIHALATMQAQDVGGRTQSGHDGRGVGQAMANSQHLWARSLSGSEPFRYRGWRDRRPGSMMHAVDGRAGRPLRARLFEADRRCRFGDRPRREPQGQRRPRPNPSSAAHSLGLPSHAPASGTRTGPCLLPHCDASRARPSSGADLAQGYSRGWEDCQEQSENITLPAPPLAFTTPSHVMAGPVPAIPMRTSAAPLASGSPAQGR